MRAAAPLVCLALCSAACEVPTPLAPSEPIGEVPTWGTGFTTPQEQPQSALGLPPVESPNQPASNALGQKPGNTGEWTGGDVVIGKGIYTALCQRCHGASGEGGMTPGVGTVPALQDPALQARVTDKEMAKVIALGRGTMPSFMRELDRSKLAGVIAYVRTLKKQ